VGEKQCQTTKMWTRRKKVVAKRKGTQEERTHLGGFSSRRNSVVGLEVKKSPRAGGRGRQMVRCGLGSEKGKSGESYKGERRSTRKSEKNAKT